VAHLKVASATCENYLSLAIMVYAEELKMVGS